MRITLTFPLTENSERFGGRSFPPTAIYYLASILRNKGHSVRVFDPYRWPTSYNNDFIRGAIDGCDLLGVSANSFNWRFAKHFIILARAQKQELQIVIGGVHPTILEKQKIAEPHWNYIVRGEGEKTMVELVDSIEKQKSLELVLGLTHFDKSGRIHINPDRPLLKPHELEEQPSPAFDLLPDKKYLTLNIESSRGCKFNCAFCSIPYRHNFRGITLKPFIHRLNETVKTGKTKINLLRNKKVPVLLLDDCFTTDKQRAVSILKELSTFKEQMSFGIQARADQLSDDIGKALSENDMFLVQIGLECGYQTGLSKINKGLRIEDSEKACAILKNYGLAEASSCAFIIGFPWETKDHCFRTLRFARHLALKYGLNINANWYEMLPGSTLWTKRKEYNQIIDFDIFDNFHYDFRNIDSFRKVHPLLSPQDIDEIEDFITELVEITPKFLPNFPFIQRERNINSAPL